MAGPTAVQMTELLTQLQEVLRAVAERGSVDRPACATYGQYRAALMASGLRSTLPGFLLQCGSLERFREFITLYHPEPRARIQFVDAALAGVAQHLANQAAPSVSPYLRSVS